MDHERADAEDLAAAYAAAWDEWSSSGDAEVWEVATSDRLDEAVAR